MPCFVFENEEMRDKNAFLGGLSHHHLSFSFFISLVKKKIPSKNEKWRSKRETFFKETFNARVFIHWKQGILIVTIMMILMMRWADENYLGNVKSWKKRMKLMYIRRIYFKDHSKQVSIFEHVCVYIWYPYEYLWMFSTRRRSTMTHHHQHRSSYILRRRFFFEAHVRLWATFHKRVAWYHRLLFSQ